MSETIAADVFTGQLFALLEETFEQVQGIYLDRGTSLFETLATISAQEASRPVSEQCATLAAQVKHVTFYLDVLADYIRTKENVRLDWSYIWRTTREVTPEEWALLKQDLERAYQQVCALFRDTQDWSDEDTLGGALAVVVHSAYHLGEIRQALCTLQPQR